MNLDIDNNDSFDESCILKYRFIQLRVEVSH